MPPVERREIGIVVAVARHRQVKQLDRAGNTCRHAVGEFHHVAHIGWIDHMLVAGIPVTEMVQQIDTGRHAIAEVDENAAERRLHFLLRAPVA